MGANQATLDALAMNAVKEIGFFLKFIYSVEDYAETHSDLVVDLLCPGVCHGGGWWCDKTDGFRIIHC